MGEEKTLELVPQTMVKVDGQDATRTELKEGQEVRASFNQVEGRDVAVQIEAREATGTGGSGSTTMTGQLDAARPAPARWAPALARRARPDTGSGTSTPPAPDTK